MNRRGFMSRFNRLIRRSKTKNSHFCLIFVDIDNLKRINDKYGHIRGDNALKRFTKIVKSTLFNNSYVSRFGGDEFILCLPDTERAVAIEIAKQMKNKLHQIKFSGDKEVPCLTASFGVVSSRDFKWTNAKEIIARADEYMYMAKRIKDSVYFGE